LPAPFKYHLFKKNDTDQHVEYHIDTENLTLWSTIVTCIYIYRSLYCSEKSAFVHSVFMCFIWFSELRLFLYTALTDYTPFPWMFVTCWFKCICSHTVPILINSSLRWATNALGKKPSLSNIDTECFLWGRKWIFMYYLDKFQASKGFDH
jgi:hypothetical protein